MQRVAQTLLLFACSYATVALGALPGRAADASLPSATEIFAHIDAAQGIAPENSREYVAYRSADGSMTASTRLHRGQDARYISAFPPFHFESGISAGRRWHQNENGQTVLDQQPIDTDPDNRDDGDDRTGFVVSAIGTPLERYRLTARTGPGSERIIDVEPQTWHIIERRDISPSGTDVTTYSDFRTEQGYTFAHRWHDEDSRDGTKSDAEVQNYTVGDVQADEVTIRAPRRLLVEFPAGQTSAELPVHFVNGHIIVRVDIAGKGRDFVLDSGAGDISIDEGLAEALGLHRYQEHQGLAAGKFSEADAIVPEMRIGSLTLHNVKVSVNPSRSMEDQHIMAVGLLGFDFLAELGVKIDYEHERVSVVPEAAYEPPTDPTMYALDVRLSDGTPNTTVYINGARGDDWTLDTGGAGTFMIFNSFARTHPDAVRDALGGEARWTSYGQVQFEGIGGAIETTPYQISDLQLGTLHFNDFIGYRVTSSVSYDGAGDGTIGPDFLHLFNVDLDYGSSRVYLVPRPFMRGKIRPHH